MSPKPCSGALSLGGAALSGFVRAAKIMSCIKSHGRAAELEGEKGLPEREGKRTVLRIQVKSIPMGGTHGPAAAVCARQSDTYTGITPVVGTS